MYYAKYLMLKRAIKISRKKPALPQGKNGGVVN